MDHYQITASMYDPYKKEWDVRVKATNIATAVARGLRELRQGPLKRKRISEITIKVIKL